MAFSIVLPILFGVIAAAMLWLIVADLLDERRIAQCFRKIGVTECPRCKKPLGDTVASTARQKVIELTRDGSRMRKNPGPSPRLIVVNCPHCSVELEFRQDGSLVSCDHQPVSS